MKVLMDFGESAHFLSRGPKVPNMSSDIAISICYDVICLMGDNHSCSSNILLLYSKIKRNCLNIKLRKKENILAIK
jgi:hypothetical protein